MKGFLLKTHFSKLRDKHKLCIIWISLSAFGFCLTAKKFIQRMFRGTKTLSVSENHFKRMTLPLQISYQQGAWHVTIQLTWGSPVKVSTNLSKVQWTWGKSPSPSLGAFECQKCSTTPSSPVRRYSFTPDASSGSPTPVPLQDFWKQFTGSPVTDVDLSLVHILLKTSENSLRILPNNGC